MKSSSLKTLLLTGVLASTAFVFTGCQSAQVRTVDSKGPQALNTAGINSQDWANAADQLVGSLLSSGALDRAPAQPAILAIDRILNNTQLNVDTDLLIKKIRVALTQTGKIALTNTMGLGERAVVASEAAEMDEMVTGKKAKMIAPHYTLYAKLIQQTDRINGVTQNTYTFQMSLNDVKSGLTVWEEEREIAKQSKKSSVSF
jgi:penicillin-binding protein activator